MKKEADNKNRLCSFLTIAIFLIFLVIPLVFFYALNLEQNTGFGLKEISSSVAIALLVTAFLVWMKNLLRKNSYLGLASSLFALAILTYSFWTQYRGPKTAMFLLIFSVVYLVYIGYCFLHYRKLDKKNAYDYEDNL